MGGGREKSVSSSRDHLIFIGALVGPCAHVAEQIGIVTDGILSFKNSRAWVSMDFT